MAELLPTSFSSEETNMAGMYSQEQSKTGTKPKRMVLLMLCMLLIGGITYVINILCGFLLELADNEKFLSQVANTMRKCSKQDNFSLALVDEYNSG